MTKMIRTIAKIDKVKCGKAHACPAIEYCPAECIIQNTRPDGGKDFPYVEVENCRGCGLCLAACPRGAISLIEIEEEV